MSPDDYARELLAAGDALPARLPPVPALPPRTWFAPAPAEPEVSLRDLYRAGVRWGHTPTRDRLEARIDGYDRELDAARGRARDLEGHLERAWTDLEDARRLYDRHERELQGALDAARARIAEIEGSTFWRMTWPLRASVHAAKSAARRLRRLPRAMAPKVATARQIAKDQGVGELVRRVAVKVAHKPAPQGLRARAALQPAIAPLDIPSSARPRVSVIVPTYGQDLHTYSCLVALAGEAASVPLEVIVADDAAPEPAAKALRGVTGVRFERGESNLGFLRNCNRAAALAGGEYLLFLNNDAVVEPGCIEALLDTFDRFPAVGAAGAKLVFPDGRLQEAGGIVWRDGSAWNYGRGDDPDRPDYNYVREADYLSGACLMVPRALFATLGGFDERYAPAYAEDADLCFRIREAGLRVMYQPAAEAVHFEGVSHGTDTGSGVKAHQAENLAKLAERWREVLAGHRANGVLPRLERDRAAKRRVLYLEACMVTPDEDAGSLRALRLLKAMRDTGCKVTFVAANLEGPERYVRPLQQEGIEVAHAPYTRSVAELLRERGADFDIVVVARHYVLAQHGDAVRRHAPQALLVFDTIDLHFVRQRRLAELERSASVARSAEATREEEVEGFRRSDVTWVVSEAEVDVVHAEVPQARVLVQSLVHDPVGSRTPFAAREGLLFVGGFRHPPNVDAATFAAREMMPKVRERLPAAVLQIVGSQVPRAIRELEGEGVHVVGYVPEVEPWLERCRVFVSPLRYGAGIKGKVLQALAHGVPVVATRVSLEGMGIVEGEDALVAETAEEFAAAIACLHEDEALWNRLSKAGPEAIARRFSTAQAKRGLEALYALAERRRAT